MPTTTRDRAADVVRCRRNGKTARSKEHEWLPARAFEALILLYEKVDDTDMADLLKLDLDRFMRNKELREDIKRGRNVR